VIEVIKNCLPTILTIVHCVFCKEKLLSSFVPNYELDSKVLVNSEIKKGVGEGVSGHCLI
jgi:hypothetical protein